MRATDKQPPNRGWLAIFARVALALGGCLGSGTSDLPTLRAAESEPSATDAPSAPAKSSDAPRPLTQRGARMGTRLQPPIAPPLSGVQALAAEAWVHAAQSAKETAASYRWRHADLDALLARPQEEWPDLHAALRDRDPIVATNAAIVLARRGDPAGIDQLAAAVRYDGAKLPMRCAAAEALGCLTHDAARQRVAELTDRYGRDPREANPAYLADLHAELIRAMVRHGARSVDPRFLAAMRSPSASVRLEAVQAWVNDGEGPLPAEAVDWRVDQDARVRVVALGILVRQRHPDARAFLLDGLNDHDFRVHAAAVAELGNLPNGEGRDLLRKLLKDPSEMIRVQALAALVASGVGEDEALPMAKDKSWRVRCVVADSLGRFPSRNGIAVARAFLNDPSPVVQEKVVAAVEAWALPEAGPVLLDAMAKIVVMTRRQAARQLAARWPPAAEFPADGAPERRAQLLAQLRQQLRDQFGVETGAARPADEAPTPEMLARVEQMLQAISTADAAVRQAVARDMTAMGPALLGALEHLALQRRQTLPEAVYVEVLPTMSPAFASLERLRYEDVSLRRRAAGELLTLAADRPLPALALERLAWITTREPDGLVWQTLLTAVGRDAREPAARLAYVAIGHPSPEVRRRACEYLAAHPDPKHVPVLLPALNDPSEVVVPAAARALGFAGRVDDTQPLRRLLLALNESIRLEAAIALSRLKDPSGAGALERLSYAQDPVIRREVAKTMGELADPTFASSLIRLLDDQQAVRQAALEALPRIAGRDVAAAAGVPQGDVSQRIELWKRWFRGEPSARR